MDNDNLLSDLLSFLGTDSQAPTTSLDLESLSPHHHYQPNDSHAKTWRDAALLIYSRL